MSVANHKTVILKNEYLEVTIKSEGAELTNVLHLPTKTAYLWNADEKFWKRNAPVLFPIVGRLKGDIFLHQNKEYKLSQHGFARDMDFELIQQTENKAIFELKSNEKSLAIYPFPFIFRISYELHGNQIVTEYEVINSDPENELPFSVGAHPAFSLPSTTTFDDYWLDFEQKENLTIQLLSQGLRNGELKDLAKNSVKLPLHKHIFDEDALVFENLKSTWVALRSNNADYQVKMYLQQCPYLGIWSKPNAPFVCIEPWWGIADKTTSNNDFLRKEGIILLQPKSDFKRHFETEFGYL